MTPLSDALTVAQKRALAALEKAYVAGEIDGEAFAAALAAFGISDPIDVAFLLSALDVCREWGVPAPTMSERVTAAKVEPATDAQWQRIRRDCEAQKVGLPETEHLTKAQASEIIGALQAGTYDPAKYSVPF